MSEETQSFNIGFDGFIWFMGVVVGSPRNDTLKVGRTKVRILGWHTEDLPTEDLPWALPIYPLDTPGGTGVPTYKDGDWVVGFFLDGKLGQQPMIFGILPSIPQGKSFFKKLATVAVKTYIKSQTGGIA
jgi:hypothetical protein